MNSAIKIQQVVMASIKLSVAEEEISKQDFNLNRKQQFDANKRNSGINYLYVKYVTETTTTTTTKETSDYLTKSLIKDKNTIKVLNYLSHYSSSDHFLKKEFDDGIVNNFIEFLFVSIDLLSNKLKESLVGIINWAASMSIDDEKTTTNITEPTNTDGTATVGGGGGGGSNNSGAGAGSSSSSSDQTNERIQYINCLYRLVGIILNYSSNSVEFSKKLVDNQFKLKNLFSSFNFLIFQLKFVVLRLCKNLFPILISLIETFLDFLICFLNSCKYLWNEWLNCSDKLINLRNRLASLLKQEHSFIYYYERIKYLCIDFNNLSNVQMDNDLICLMRNQYNDSIYFLNEQLNTNKRFLINSQQVLNQLKFLEVYSTLVLKKMNDTTTGTTSTDLETNINYNQLIDLLVRIGSCCIDSINENNLKWIHFFENNRENFLAQILLIFLNLSRSTYSKKFSTQYEQSSNAISFTLDIFKLIINSTSLINTDTETSFKNILDLNISLTSNLLIVSNKFKEKFLDLNCLNVLAKLMRIEKMKTENCFVNKTHHIIKLVYDYQHIDDDDDDDENNQQLNLDTKDNHVSTNHSNTSFESIFAKVPFSSSNSIYAENTCKCLSTPISSSELLIEQDLASSSEEKEKTFYYGLTSISSVDNNNDNDKFSSFESDPFMSKIESMFQLSPSKSTWRKYSSDFMSENLFHYLELTLSSANDDELNLRSIMFRNVSVYLFESIESNQIEYETLKSKQHQQTLIRFLTKFIQLFIKKLFAYLLKDDFLLTDRIDDADKCCLNIINDDELNFIKLISYLIEFLVMSKNLALQSFEFCVEAQKNFMYNLFLFLSDDLFVKYVSSASSGTGGSGNIESANDEMEKFDFKLDLIKNLAELSFRLISILSKEENHSKINWNDLGLVEKYFKSAEYLSRASLRYCVISFVFQYDHNHEENKNQPAPLPSPSPSPSSSNSDFNLRLNDEKCVRLRKRDNAIKYLTKLNDDPKRILNDRQAIKAIVYLIYNRFQFEDISSLNLQKDLIRFFLSFFKYCVEFIAKNKRNLNVEELSPYLDTFKSQLYKILSFLNLLLFVFCMFSTESLNFCNYFQEICEDNNNNESNGILILFDLATSRFLIRHLVCNSMHKIMNEFAEDSLSLSLNVLQTISRTAYKYKSLWEKSNAMNKFLEISKYYELIKIKMKNFNYIKYNGDVTKINRQFLKQDFTDRNKTFAYFALANLATEEDINSLADGIKPILEYIIENIDYLANLLVNNVTYRLKMNIDENDQMASEVIYSCTIDWHLVELINPLFYFAKCDIIKKLIYNDFKMSKTIRKIIYNGNDAEQEYALKLLYQLCFDETIAKDIMDDKKLYEFIKNLKSKRKGFVKNRDGILWVLKNKFEAKPVKSNENDVNNVPNENENKQPANIIEEKQEKHIMISYNRDNRDLCLDIKTELERINRKVWIDVEDIHGSSLEAMANAIEQSSCVIICMTEKYKESPNCRLEAEYVMQLKKPFIPLIMQKHFKPCGWLGLILGSKIYIDFTKYQFDDCMKRLVKELENLSLTTTKVKDPCLTTSEVATAVVVPTMVCEKIQENNELDGSRSSIVKSWSQSDVSNWMKDSNINNSIERNLKDCDGLLLFEIYKFYKKMPKFFFKKLEKDSNNKLKLIDLVKFTFELEKLFE